jgi:3'-5' exoribonuclease
MHINIIDTEFDKVYEDVYILKDHAIRTTKNNSPYLNVTIMDKTGEINGNMFTSWSPSLNLVDGDFIKINFKKQRYNDKPNIFINAIHNVEDKSEINIADFVPVSPISSKTLFHEMYETLINFKNKKLANIGLYILKENKDKLISIPGGKSVHHDCLGGLALHTGSMLRVAKGIAENYKEMINEELFYLGIIIHDIKKVDEFEISKLGLVSDYTFKGKLLGHITMGVAYVGEVCDKLGIDENTKTVVQHMILSHHGKPEYGSSVKPMILEAYLIHCVDMIDSRVQIYNKAIENIEPNTFSEKQFALDGIQVYKHDL